MTEGNKTCKKNPYVVIQQNINICFSFYYRISSMKVWSFWTRWSRITVTYPGYIQSPPYHLVWKQSRCIWMQNPCYITAWQQIATIQIPQAQLQLQRRQQLKLPLTTKNNKKNSITIIDIDKTLFSCFLLLLLDFFLIQLYHHVPIYIPQFLQKSRDHNKDIDLTYCLDSFIYNCTGSLALVDFGGMVFTFHNSPNI